MIATSTHMLPIAEDLGTVPEMVPPLFERNGHLRDQSDALGKKMERGQTLYPHPILSSDKHHLHLHTRYRYARPMVEKF